MHEKIDEVMALVEEYGESIHEGDFLRIQSDRFESIRAKLCELLQPSESGEIENVYSALYTLYSFAYTYSDINASDKGKDAMMKASKLLDDYYPKKGQE